MAKGVWSAALVLLSSLAAAQEPGSPARAADDTQTSPAAAESSTGMDSLWSDLEAAREPDPPAPPAPAADALETIPVASGTDSPTTDAPAKQPAAPVNRFIEEIVVTAQKREENLQDVPISIQAFSGDALEAHGVSEPQSLERITPGLTYSQHIGNALVYLRGVGSDVFLPGASPSVATYIDGVYQPVSQAIAQSFFKLERVEVLKGPQGTLFGRNTTGGAINIITRKPGDQFEATVDTEIGSFATRKIGVFLSGPATESLTYSVSGLYHRNGTYLDFVDESPVQSVSDTVNQGFNARLLWQATDTLSATVGGFSLHSDAAAGQLVTPQNVRPLGTAAGIEPLGPYQVGTDVHPRALTDNQMMFTEIAWRPDAFDLKFLASHQEFEGEGNSDFDQSPQNIASIHSIIRDRTVTSELQFLSKPDGMFPDWLTWTSGLYYFQAEGGFYPVDVNVSNPGFTLNQDGTVRAEAYAAYLQTTAMLRDWLGLTVGGRIQQEKRDVETSATLIRTAGGGEIPVSPPAAMSRSSSDFSPKIVIDLKPGDDQLIYLSWQKGYKSGDFNVPAYTEPPTYVMPEIVSTFELGNKGTVFDGQLRYSLAAFHNRFENIQTLVNALASGSGTNFVNAASATIYGAEFDLTLQPAPDYLPGLVINAGGAWLHGRYESFPNGPGYDPVTGLYFGTGSATEPEGRDFSGHESVRTPEFTFTISPSYSTPVPGGNLEVSVDYYSNSGYFFDTQNAMTQPSYDMLGARASYLYEPWDLRVSAFGRNLTDTQYFFNKSALDFDEYWAYAPPAQYGVQISWTYR